MSAAKGKGPVFDPGLCRCCGNMKKCRVLNVEYEFSGQKEVYSDMIMDCFGLLLSHLDGAPSERLICATCVTWVRGALNFRRQVLQCEEAFLSMKMYDSNHCEDSIPDSSTENKPVDTLPPTVTETPLPLHVKIETVKVEKMDLDHEGDDEHCGDALADVADDNDNSTPKPVQMDPDLNDDSNDDLPLKHHVTRTKPNNTTSIVRKKTEGIKKKVDKPMLPYHRMPMSKVQQLIREKDPSYMAETNILCIVEYSYVCPFKCRHNNILCYYCGENFSDPNVLRTHTSNSHHPKKFKITEMRNMIKLDLTRIDCRLCTAKIDTLDGFKKHITSVHGKKYFFNFKDSVLPFKLSRNEIKCAVCEIVFPYFHALNKHMNQHFSNYVCETCGLGFVDRGRFMMHVSRHEEGDFPCPDCGKIFKANYNRDLHIDRVHKKKGRVYCPKCDVKLMSYPQKLKHLVEVHGEEPLSFPCDRCDRIFDTRRTLTVHRRKEHLKDYRYECHCCGQKFFTRFALNNHMPTHTGERNFKCKVCEKSYPRLKTLKDHMRIHTNDRRYRCHVCGQAFIQNCSLKGHMKSQHPEYEIRM